MDDKRKWIVLVILLIVLNIFAVEVSSVTGSMTSSESRYFTVSEVYERALLDDYVYVTGTVSKVLKDHVSEKGFTYQQFMLSDGEQDIKIFCSVKYGESGVKENDRIKFNGKFKKFYNQYEIYGFCSEINDLQ